MTNARTAPRHTPEHAFLLKEAAAKETQDLARMRDVLEVELRDPKVRAALERANAAAETESSYRALAVVPAPDPSELPPRADKGCPACWYSLKDFLKEWFCKGGRHGFLWLRSCKIREPHMHQHCTRCGATWVAQPHSSARYL